MTMMTQVANPSLKAIAFDAYAATCFTTSWANRNGQPDKVLDVSPNTAGHQLTDVLAYG
jgi:hypothetical protein